MQRRCATLCRVFVFFAVLAKAGAAIGGDSHLANFSARAWVGSNGEVVISGFAVAATEQVLVRAVGPGLEPYGVPGRLSDPVLTLFDDAGRIVATNDNWNAADAPFFEVVGAFPLRAGSADAVLVVTLPAGTFTAVVSGAHGATGLALVEVYDASPESSHLVNISARARADTGANSLIPGLAIMRGTGPRRLLLRAAGPALKPFGVPGVLEDPRLTLVAENGVVLERNDNWITLDPSLLTGAVTVAGAFPFAAGETRDAALVSDLLPGLYTIKVEAGAGQPGVSLVEVYDVTPTGSPAIITTSMSASRAYESDGRLASFTISRLGDISHLLAVDFTLSGAARNGIDYAPLGRRAILVPGQTSVTMQVRPVRDTLREPAEDVTITLGPGLGYTLGTVRAATAMIADAPDAVFVGALAPTAAARDSLGHGAVVVHLNAAQTAATVNVSVANLSSPQAAARLRLESGEEVGLLPVGQIADGTWALTATAGRTVADIVRALEAGTVHLLIATERYPDGELRGTLLEAAAARPFVAPPAPTPAPTAPASDQEAARFLMQATFGPTSASIAQLRTTTYAQWITAQMAVPPSLHRAAALADWAAHPEDGSTQSVGPGKTNRQCAWWKIAVEGEDQLRQRVAFALSEIFVISDLAVQVELNQEGAANFHDLLVRNAFGNYRDLLEQVSLSPIMGAYLGHLRSAGGAAIGAMRPDENYAREIMQLFSIGLVQLNPDGTPRLSADGTPIASYDQGTIGEMARVFTGWGFQSADTSAPLFNGALPDFINPMVAYPELHDNGAKTIVGGRALPAGQTGERDLAVTLDALAQHANTGPFLARRMIQRLVTSNPSPGYVYRVASVFANNGSGVRGDLGAVVRAILLDHEARSPAVAALPGFGKLKEPVLRLTALLRAGRATGLEGRYRILTTDAAMAQRPFSSPTVFNFFQPEYMPAGILEDNGLCAPEFQILTDTTAVTGPNLLRSHAFGAPAGVALNLAELLPLAGDPAALVERANLLLAAGGMSAAARARLVQMLAEFSPATTADERVRSVLYLAACSSAAAIQR